MTRSISYSEVSMANTCEAQWDFAYGGHLAGTCLKPRELGLKLSDGRAFGAAAAAWHAFPRDETLLNWPYVPLLAGIDAHTALRASFAQDIADQSELGVWFSPEAQLEQEGRLGAILDHFTTIGTPLANLTRVEGGLDIPIPSRHGGHNSSSRYRFEGYLDGFTIDESGNEWLYECKLRDQLTPAWQIQLARQVRWYAFCRRRETNRDIVGVMVEERLSEPPKPPRLVKAKSKAEPQDERGMTPSHAKDQLCTPEAYTTLCEEYEVQPHIDTLAALEGRVWQHRIPIQFGPDELDESGLELVSAAQKIAELDSGKRYPIRNTQPRLCRSCRWRQACPNPGDKLYLETLYQEVLPKRARGPRERVVSASPAGDPPAQSSVESSVPRAAPGGTCGAPIGQQPPSCAEPDSTAAAGSLAGARNGSHSAEVFDFAHASYAETEPLHFKGAFA